MAVIQVRGLSFSYRAYEPGRASTAVLDKLSFDVEEGAFCVLTGPTGCGKSTLLRLMKPEIAPRGECGGSITVAGRPFVLDGVRQPIAPAESALLVGFVAQDPEAQIICDTVRAELAFGLENRGVPPHAMRRRIAEATGFLGVDGWMDLKTAELSGGQKQLLNLAAALAMRPRILLLDEPTAQLDPHARRRFLSALASVNRELGCTVLMSTHTPELAAEFATWQISLGELPPAVPFRDSQRLAGEYRREGRAAIDAPFAVQAREVDFRYSRAGGWVLQDASTVLERGRVHAYLGGNGCGKTTLLKVLAGACKPQRGAVRAATGLRRAYLPQDPKTVFVCESVGEELHEWHARFGYGREQEREAARRFGLDGMMDRHPYDLSGGQQQQLALAKLLLSHPQLLLLDEPTKGLDAGSAAQVARLIRRIADEGAAVGIATHDAALVRVLADDVSLVFDGSLACTLPAGEYFEGSLVHRPDAVSRLFGALA